jgi:hypothetical protein
MSEQFYLDLDAVSPNVEFTIKLAGVEHKVKESSVEDFIANARAIEKLALNASPIDEIELILSIITRALPTCDAAVLKKMSLGQLMTIRDFVMTANGEKAEEVGPATASAEGNEPAAK